MKMTRGKYKVEVAYITDDGERFGVDEYKTNRESLFGMFKILSPFESEGWSSALNRLRNGNCFVLDLFGNGMRKVVKMTKIS